MSYKFYTLSLVYKCRILRIPRSLYKRSCVSVNIQIFFLTPFNISYEVKSPTHIQSCLILNNVVTK